MVFLEKKFLEWGLHIDQGNLSGTVFNGICKRRVGGNAQGIEVTDYLAGAVLIIHNIPLVDLDVFLAGVPGSLEIGSWRTPSTAA